MLRLVSTACLGLAAAVAMSTVSAATLLESKDSKGMVQSIYFEGAKMRAQERGAKEYMLFDMAKQKMYAVNPGDRQVVDLSGFLAQRSGKSGSARKVAAKLSRKGAGPTVAGYATEHYVVTANGKKCADEYLSKKAMADLKATMTASERFWQLGEDYQPGMGGAMSDPCDLVDTQIGKSYKKYGLPLRVVEADGSLSMEITRISKNAALPPGGFSVPAGYAVVDAHKQMQDAMREAQKPTSSSGKDGMGMSPDALRRGMEEMMKQMGR